MVAYHQKSQFSTVFDNCFCQKDENINNFVNLYRYDIDMSALKIHLKIKK